MLTPKEQKIIATIRREAAVTGHSDDRTKAELRREQRTLLAIIDRLAAPAPELERRYAKDVADWCQRSLDSARATGHLETRALVQNVELIIKALRAYSLGTEARQACQLLVKWHRAVFDGGKQALRLENGYPVDRTDVDEAARLAYLALGGPARGPRHPMPYALDEAEYITPEMHAAAPTVDDILSALLCDDCPPVDYCTDKTRCRECPRRKEDAA